jgi:divalent metal cation (Fe/Co/Zn/Cd) transporter
LLLRRGLRLEYATLAWNVFGSVLVLAASVAALSVALAGFGLDSLIEIAASAVVVWQLKGSDKTREGARLLSRRVDFAWAKFAFCTHASDAG